MHTEVQHSGNNLVDGVAVLTVELQDIEGLESLLVHLGVRLGWHIGGAVVGDVGVVLGGGQSKGSLVRVLSQQLVEDVEVTLARSLVGDTGLLQQVGSDRGSRNAGVVSKVDRDELSKTGRVIVLGRLGVTEGLKQRIGLDQLLLKETMLTSGGDVTGNGGQVLDNLLGVLGLTGTWKISKRNKYSRKSTE